jgi:hypothetical protein
MQNENQRSRVLLKRGINFSFPLVSHSFDGEKKQEKVKPPTAEQFCMHSIQSQELNAKGEGESRLR